MQFAKSSLFACHCGDRTLSVGLGPTPGEYIHTYIHAYIHTYMHTCMHACMHTYIHTYIHKPVRPLGGTDAFPDNTHRALLLVRQSPGQQNAHRHLE